MSSSRETTALGLHLRVTVCEEISEQHGTSHMWVYDLGSGRMRPPTVATENVTGLRLTPAYSHLDRDALDRAVRNTP